VVLESFFFVLVFVLALFCVATFPGVIFRRTTTVCAYDTNPCVVSVSCLPLSQPIVRVIFDARPVSFLLFSKHASGCHVLLALLIGLLGSWFLTPQQIWVSFFIHYSFPILLLEFASLWHFVIAKTASFFPHLSQGTKEALW